MSFLEFIVACAPNRKRHRLAEQLKGGVATQNPSEPRAVRRQPQIQRLPTRIGEAAATLVGFLSAARYASAQHGTESDTCRNLNQEASLYLTKARMVNRYDEKIAALYYIDRSVRETRTFTPWRGASGCCSMPCGANAGRSSRNPHRFTGASPRTTSRSRLRDHIHPLLPAALRAAPGFGRRPQENHRRPTTIRRIRP